MKFIIDRESLLPPLQAIVGVIEKRQTMPVLANVLMIVEDDVLTLTGTDLEIQIVAKLPVSQASKGGITVPARKLVDLCRLLPAHAELAFEQDGGKVKLLSKRSRFTLNCLPAEDYPEFSETDLDKRFSIPAERFQKALSKTLFCMANQDVRYYLNGLLLNISNSQIKLVASDGHRLAIFEDRLEQATGYEARIIIPRKGVVELARLLADLDGDLNVMFSNNHIKVAMGNLIFSAKLVDAKYPDFSKVFQQPFQEPLVFPKQELKETLTRVAVLSNEKFKGITLDIDKGNMKVSTHNPEHDEAEEDLVVDYSGEPMAIAFNAQYFLDAITNLDSEDAVLTIAQNLSSCFITEPKECEYQFVVMPMRL